MCIALRKTYRPNPGNRKWRILRKLVFIRDDFTCQYCGLQTFDTSELTVDHITALCKGGTNLEANLKTACYPCNRAKGGK